MDPSESFAVVASFLAMTAQVRPNTQPAPEPSSLKNWLAILRLAGSSHGNDKTDGDG